MRKKLANNRVRRAGAIRTASRGQTMVEYALLLAAIALTAFAGLGTTGQKITASIGISASRAGSGATAGGGVSVIIPDPS